MLQPKAVGVHAVPSEQIAWSWPVPGHATSGFVASHKSICRFDQDLLRLELPRSATDVRADTAGVNPGNSVAR